MIKIINNLMENQKRSALTIFVTILHFLEVTAREYGVGNKSIIGIGFL